MYVRYILIFIHIVTMYYFNDNFIIIAVTSSVIIWNYITNTCTKSITNTNATYMVTSKYDLSSITIFNYIKALKDNFEK